MRNVSLVVMLFLSTISLAQADDTDPATVQARQQYQQMIEQSQKKLQLQQQQQMQQLLQFHQQLAAQQTAQGSSAQNALAPTTPRLLQTPIMPTTSMPAPNNQSNMNEWTKPSPYAAPKPNPWAPKPQTQSTTNNADGSSNIYLPPTNAPTTNTNH